MTSHLEDPVFVHPALEAAAEPDPLITRSLTNLYLYWGCGHQTIIQVQAVTITYGERTIAHPSVITSPESCFQCKLVRALRSI